MLRSVQFSPMGTIPLTVTCTIQHSHRSMEAVAQEKYRRSSLSGLKEAQKVSWKVVQDCRQESLPLKT